MLCRSFTGASRLFGVLARLLFRTIASRIFPSEMTRPPSGGLVIGLLPRGSIVIDDLAAVAIVIEVPIMISLQDDDLVAVPVLIALAHHIAVAVAIMMAFADGDSDRADADSHLVRQ